MRRWTWGIIALAVLAAACSSGTSRAASGPTTTTTIALPAGTRVVHVSTRPGQRIDGFGASGAWWPNDLANFPPAYQQTAAQLLFNRLAIGLSGYRYNIGGGGKGVTNPARAPKEFRADDAGRVFLKAASDMHVEMLTGFVNSAPPQFTTNGQACGGQLKPGRESAYAQYLANIVKTLHDKDHVTLQYVSPMNEPDDNFGGCGQEGMAVPISQRAAVVQSLGRALAATAPYAHVIADETTADLLIAQNTQQWLTPDTARYVAAIAHHTYDFPTNAIRAVVPKALTRFGKPTWMTEICCYKGSGSGASSFGSGFDPSMTQGLWLADQVFGDLTVARDSAWYWWTALSPELGCSPAPHAVCGYVNNAQGINDGLLYYDPNYAKTHNYTLIPTKRYYVLGQFSRFVRPGALRYDATGAPPGVKVMAFAQGKQWIIVTWNDTDKSVTFGVSLPGTSSVAMGYSTSPTFNLAGAPRPKRTNTGAWLVPLAGQTVSTFTFG